jgi:hypothetical protein
MVILFRRYGDSLFASASRRMKQGTMSKHNKHNCEVCCNTGILSAKLVNEEEGGRHIAVVVCSGHFSSENAEKNMLAMHKATGHDVNVLRVEKHGDKEKNNG